MILVKNPHFLHSWSVLARIDQEKMFTDVLNKKEDNIAHDDDGDDDENRLCTRFSSILSIGSSLIGASIETALGTRGLSRVSACWPSGSRKS